MNYGPLLFLAAFFGLAGSWFGFVLTPQMQLGQLQQTNSLAGTATYPVARPGLARQGLEVYRANGCAYCHSQQVGQSGTALQVALTEPGTNNAAVVAALQKLSWSLTNQPALLTPLAPMKPGLSPTEAGELLAALPKAIVLAETKDAADAAVKALNATGAKAQLWITPLGPDLARGWGKRRTVAEDFLFDYPVMLGSQRIGPDLANVGSRLPDPNWHLLHLYAPRLQVQKSAMPPYRFLFEKRKIERAPSPDALSSLKEYAPPPGYEIVPTAEAKALVAYLLSLCADAPLFDAPMTFASAPAATNAPAK